MRMRIFRYFCVLVSSLVLINSAIFAAESDFETWNKTDNKKLYGLSVYADLVGPVVSIVSDKVTDFSFGADVDLFHAAYPTFEMGYSVYDATDDYHYALLQPDDYSYKCSGTYYKIGVKFNMLNGYRSKKTIPMLYLGAKFAFSPSHFEIEDVALNNEFWNLDKSVSVEGRGVVKWAEFAFGVRYPVSKHLFLALEGDLKEFATKKAFNGDINGGGKMLVHQTYSPGYGDINGSHWSVKYTLGLFIPTKEVKRKK